jgi:hypothetical protein
MKQQAIRAFASVATKLNANKRKHCFELYGLDFMISQDGQPWLIEVNTNPCIETPSVLLGILLPRVLDDLFRLTIDRVYGTKLPAESKYTIEGHQNNINMW